MMPDQVYELSQLYVAERLERAERDRLVAAFGQPRSYLSEITAWSGGLLVRVGRRLEATGGAVAVPQPVERHQRTLSRA